MHDLHDAGSGCRDLRREDEKKDSLEHHNIAQLPPKMDNNYSNIGSGAVTGQTSRDRLNTRPNEPPALPYNLRDHKPAIIIAFSIMLIFDCIMETLVFYMLRTFTTLDEKVIFAIVVGPALWSSIDWARRTWRMVQPSDEYRPLGAGRWTVSLCTICSVHPSSTKPKRSGTFSISTIPDLSPSLPFSSP